MMNSEQASASTSHKSIWCGLDQHGIDIRWSYAIHNFKNNKQELEINPLLHGEPLKRNYNGTDVFIFSAPAYRS